jgi:hypothetical protein
MSLTKAIQHNQSLFIAALISTLCFGSMLGCHLTHAQKKDIITQAVPIAKALTPGVPIPWEQIALLVTALLGSGSIIDNRRKDVLVKRLKTENANALQLVTKLVAPPNNNTPRVEFPCQN